eukprot:gene24950-45865_t
MKDWVCTLTATHDIARVFAKRLGKTAEELHEKYPPQHHPVVRTHPETGRRTLYVNTGFTTHIDGLSPKESDWLLAHLYAQATLPEYQCRFRWRPNSIAFWDNRACQHYAASDYFPAVRVMERVTVAGDRPFFDPSREPVKAAQRLAHLLAMGRTGDDHVDHRQRRVRVAAGADVAHLVAGVGERTSVRGALVAERVELARDDRGRREAGQVGGQQRRRERIGAVGLVDVVVGEPAHECRGEHVSVAVVDVRLGAHAQIGDRG